MADNAVPQPADDSYETAAGEKLTVAAAKGLLANDFDKDGDRLAVIAVTTPKLGDVSVDADGGFTYTPASGVSGASRADTFVYTVSDGEDKASATVTIVIEANAKPEPRNDSYAVDADAALTVAAADGLLANDSDANGGALAVIDIPTAPSKGFVDVAADGSFVYTPANGVSGADMFVYSISDGEDTASATVVIDIVANAPPVAINDTYTVGFGETLTVDAANGLLGNDFDPDGDDIVLQSFQTPTLGSLQATTDGSFLFTPNEGASGGETFFYTIRDEHGATASATATIMIEANTPPVAVSDAYTVRFDETLTVDAANGLLGNDFDPDGDDIVLQSFQTPTLGSLQATTDGSFLFTPNEGASGGETFFYTIRDEHGATVSATATIMIEANTPPVAVDDTYTVRFDETLTVDAANGLLGNDFDPDGDDIVLQSFQTPTLGSLQATTDGSFLFTPNEGASGGETFFYTIRDEHGATASATATIVIDSNSPPVAVDDAYTVRFDETLTVDAANGLLGNDFDPDGDDIALQLFQTPTLGSLQATTDGSFVFTPNEGASGSETFFYTIRDEQGAVASANATIVIDANTPPVAANDIYTTGFEAPLIVNAASGLLANDFDPDGDDLAVVALQSPSFGALSANASGAFTYTPDDGASGLDTFVYIISDGVTTASATVSVVVAANTAPTAVDDFYTTGFEEALTVDATDGLLANDFDDDGDDIAVVAFHSPARGSLSPTIDGAFVYTPDDGESGVDVFAYFISDGDRTGSATVTVVIEANTPPDAVDDAYQTGVDETLTVDAATGLLANDFDEDGDAISVVAFHDPSLGKLLPTASGSFVYTPDPGAAGVDMFAYFISDGSATRSATVAIAVGDVNTPPFAKDDAFRTDEDTAIKGDVLANDSDADDDNLAVIALNGDKADVGTAVKLKSGAVLSLDADGGFVYEPNGSFEALGARGATQDSFVYAVSDGEGGSATATATVQIAGRNDAPIFSAKTAFTVLENRTGVGFVGARDVDRGDDLHYAIDKAFDAAFFGIDKATGALRFLKPPDFEAPADADADNVYGVRVRVSDGAETVAQDIAVTVVDDADETPAAVALTGDAGANRVAGSAGDDLLAGVEGDDRLIGFDGDDDLNGGEGDDVLNGAGGRDRLEGGGQHDALIGGADDDALFGDGGNDLLHGGGGDDALNGGAGADLLRGEEGSDILNGDGGDDLLDGGDDADALDGGAGFDVLRGGGGPDEFFLNDGDAADLIVDFEIGLDRLVFAAGAAATGDVTATAFNGRPALLAMSGDVSVLLLGVGAAEFDALV